MKISDLKAGASNVTIDAVVVEKEDSREVVTKYGKKLTVAHVVLKDDTGSIGMSLWGDDIDKVDVGDKVRITNGYVSEFRGTPQMSTGKYGKLEVIEKGAGGKESSEGDEPEDDEGGSLEEDQM
ncbi:MAG: DNA-binding protein [Candidatus Micrarchaeia archaeon]